MQRSRFLMLRPREMFFYTKQYFKSLRQLLYLLKLPPYILCYSYEGFRDHFIVLGHSSFALMQHKEASPIDRFDGMKQDSLLSMYHDVHMRVGYEICEEEFGAERLQKFFAIATELRKLSIVVVTTNESHSTRYLDNILVIMDRFASFPAGQATSTLLRKEGSQQGHDITVDYMMSKDYSKICANQSAFVANMASSIRDLRDILATMEHLYSILPGQATSVAA